MQGVVSNRTGSERNGPFGQVGASKAVEKVLSTNNIVNRKVLRSMGIVEAGKMKNVDKGRKWMWWFLGIIAGMQIYFVQELVAAFVLFALGFAGIAMVIGSLYMLHKTWALAVGRMADSQHPVVVAARHGVYAVEDMARRPFRGSAAAR
jgi:hypothetical protein